MKEKILSGESNEQSNIQNLPEEIKQNILSYLSDLDRIKFGKICKANYVLAHSSDFWKKRCDKLLILCENSSNPKEVFKNAVTHTNRKYFVIGYHLQIEKIQIGFNKDHDSLEGQILCVFPKGSFILYENQEEACSKAKKELELVCPSDLNNAEFTMPIFTIRFKKCLRINSQNEVSAKDEDFEVFKAKILGFEKEVHFQQTFLVSHVAHLRINTL